MRAVYDELLGTITNIPSYINYMKKIFYASALLLILAPLLLSAPVAFGALIPHVETSAEPNLHRALPLLFPSSSAPSKKPQSSAALAPDASQASLGPNLILNPSVEAAGTGGVPANWRKGGYGANTRVLTYPTGGTGGNATKAIGVSVSGYSSGDAKWYPDEIAVTPGKTYQFNDMYMASAASIVEIRFTLSGGAFSYKDIARPAATASFGSASGQFVAPAGAVSATIFHLIKSNGTLVTDDYSLQEVTAQANNYLANGNFETAGSGGLPADWNRGGYGSNTRTFTYPVPGESGSGAKLMVTNYSTGDAKWASDPVALPQGSYTYADSYISTTPSYLTAEFGYSDGSHTYLDLKALPLSSGWAHASAVFTMPQNATSARVFHLIKSNGSLTLDNASISQASAGQGIFSTGAVTFRFDDNFKSQYTSVAPVLDAAGFKGTFYFVSQQVSDTGFPGYMSVAQAKDLAARGHEIGAHTRTHPHLTTLSSQEQQAEIAGSRQDIQGWNVGPVLSFAYPFGEYDATTTAIVANAGFSSGAATIGGYVTPSSDHYQLEYRELHNDTTLAQVKQWIDTAASTHTWLILTFHDVINNGGTYTSTPAMFQNIVNYVKQKGIPVVTTSQGMQSM